MKSKVIAVSLVCILSALFISCGNAVETDNTDINVEEEKATPAWTAPVYEEFAITDYVSMQVPKNWRNSKSKLSDDSDAFYWYPYDDNLTMMYIYREQNDSSDFDESDFKYVINKMADEQLKTDDIEIIVNNTSSTSYTLYRAECTSTNSNANASFKTIAYGLYNDGYFICFFFMEQDEIDWNFNKFCENTIKTVHVTSAEEKMQGQFTAAKNSETKLNLWTFLSDDSDYTIDKEMADSYFYSDGVVYDYTDNTYTNDSFNFIEKTEDGFTKLYLSSKIENVKIPEDIEDGNGIIIYCYIDSKLKPQIVGIESAEAPFALDEYRNFVLNQYASYSYNEIARNPDSFKGEKIKVTGKVIQVQESGSNIVMRVNDKGSYNNTYYVTYYLKSGSDRILENDTITIYGTVKGLKTYTTVLGSSVSIPEISASEIIIN